MRRSQFLLRDVGWIVAIVGVLLSWWVDHSHQAQQQNVAHEELSRMRAMLMMLRFDPRYASSELSHNDGE